MNTLKPAHVLRERSTKVSLVRMNLDKEKQYIINWLEKTSASGSYSFSYVCSQSFLNNWEIGKQFISDWLVTHGYKVKVINSRCFEISWDEAIADEW